MAEIVGILAGILTSFASLPQLFKVVKTKSVNDLSISYYSVLLIGCFLWVIYGILINSFSVVVFNVFTFLMLFSVFSFILLYRR